MKICLISPEFPPYIWGGAGKYSYEISHRLANKGIKVHVIAAKNDNSPNMENQNNVLVHRYKMDLRSPITHFSSSWIINKKIKKIDKEENFDLFHGIYGHYFLNTKKPLVSTVLHTFNQLNKYRTYEFSGIKQYYSYYYYKLHSQLEKKILIDSSKIICISDSTKRNVIEEYRINESLINRIYIGIDLAKFKPCKKDESRDYLNLDEERPIIINVSSLSSPRKRAIDIIKSIIFLKEKFPNILLLLIGKDNARLKSFFMNYIHRFNLENNVKFTGRVSEDDLIKYYASSDVFVLSSIFEGQGISILEAMAMKIPVIATNTSSIPELIKNKKSGLLVPILQPKKIADSIEILLMNKNLRNKLIKNASRSVKSNFDIKKTIEETIKTYESVN